MRKDAQALIISTLELSGVEQMALDLHFLEKTITNIESLFTLRFYFWEGDWLSLGYHQKDIPQHWEKLVEEGLIKIVRRPSGGGAVLHSGGITYALTFKKTFYKSFSYELVNNWLIKSFSELGLYLERGNLKKSFIKQNCFSSSYVSDLVDQYGFKRIGSAQYRKKGAFLQHGEIQLNPPRDLWIKLFGEESPPKINLNITKREVIKYLKSSFLENKTNFKIENVKYTSDDIKKLL